MNPFGGAARGGLDLEAMLRQAQQAQQRAAEMQERRAELRVVGATEDGLVRATVDGGGQVVDLYLDPRSMRLDSQSLAEKVMAAIRRAYEEYQAQADQMAGEAMGDPELYEKIKSGRFDMSEYLRQHGVNIPGLSA